MRPEEIKQTLVRWIKENHPALPLPGETVLERHQLLAFYDHLEVAMLELNLHDTYPDYLRLIRKRRNFIRRLDDAEFKKEIFRSRTAF